MSGRDDSSERRLTARRKATGLAFLAAGYTAWVRRRNRRIRRPAVRGPEGAPYAYRRAVYSDGAEVTYLDAGEGPGSPLVLVPGADGIKETFRYQVPAFARRHRVIAADLRDRFRPDDTFDRFADDVVELMDERAVPEAIVIGQSLGGAVALRLATRHAGRVRGLVICNSLTRVTFEHVGLNRTALVPLARLTTRYLPTGLSRVLGEMWSRAEVWIFDNSPGRANIVDYALWTGPRTVSSLVSKRRVDLLREVDLRPELARITAPTLIVRGERDFYMPPGWWDEILAAVPGSRSVGIPEAGHCNHVSMPGAYNQVVLRWIDEIEADAPETGDFVFSDQEPASGEGT